MYCPKCGKQGAEDVKFCTSCGASLSTANVNTENRVEYFYTVPQAKFILLHVLTFGLYDLFWFGRNWYLIMDQEKSKIYPFWRTVFSPIFFWSLVEKIQKTAKRKGYSRGYWSTGLTITYIAFVFGARGENVWWIYLFGFLPFLPVIDATTFVNSNTTGAVVDNKYNAIEVLAAVVGGTLTFFAILGTLA